LYAIQNANSALLTFQYAHKAVSRTNKQEGY